MHPARHDEYGTPSELIVPDRNPYADPPPVDTPDHGSKAAGQPFSIAGIIGIVLVTLGWAVALLPLIAWIRSFSGYGDGMGSFFNVIGFLGIVALVVSVAGFIAGLRAGNRKLAARLYIIPSLVWQLPIVVAIVWLLAALASYNAT